MSIPWHHCKRYLLLVKMWSDLLKYSVIEHGYHIFGEPRKSPLQHYASNIQRLWICRGKNYHSQMMLYEFNGGMQSNSAESNLTTPKYNMPVENIDQANRFWGDWINFVPLNRVHCMVHRFDGTCVLFFIFAGSGLNKTKNFLENTSDAICTQFSSANCNIY